MFIPIKKELATTVTSRHHEDAFGNAIFSKNGMATLQCAV